MPGSAWKNNPLTRIVAYGDATIRAIIFVNIGMYVLSLLLYPKGIGFSASIFQLLSPSGDSLLLLGETGKVPIAVYHRWWSLVSANYLHGSLIHITFNMIAFRQLALLSAGEYGTYRMFTIYTLGGVFGFFVSYLAGVRYTIGASAAVCSLLGSLLYYGKSRGGVYGQAIYRQVGGWIIGIFIFGLMPGINNWGHGGGIAAGVILGWLLGYGEAKRETQFHKVLAISCAVATLAALCWAVLSGIIFRLM